MTKTYSNKSNARRAARKTMTDDQYTIEACGVTGGFYICPKKDIAEMDEFGLGTDEASAKCPHCGVNHMENGYGYHDPADGFHHEERMHSCLGCGGEWGENIPSSDFVVAYKEAGGQMPRGMCKALRTVAASWTGTRAEYMAEARNMGINATIAGRSWQMAGRSRHNENKE